MLKAEGSEDHTDRRQAVKQASKQALFLFFPLCLFSSTSLSLSLAQPSSLPLLFYFSTAEEFKRR
jgi:hypothetical protein